MGRRLLRFFFLSTVVLGLLGLATIFVTYLVIAPDLPDVETLRDVQLQVPLRVQSADGRLIAVYGEKRRIPAALSEMPPHLVQAFISGEDARFYDHPGVDWQGITRAVWHIVRTGEKGPGGSTITQQLARNFFLSFEQTYSRKIKEIFLALKIERELSKNEILELYLNKIYLGHRAYGVGAAAQVYYGARLDELTLAQCAMIAALPKAPSRINPITNPARALERRNYVLNRMLELGHISRSEFDNAIAERDRAYYHGPVVEVDAPYVGEMARAEATRLLGAEAYTGGYQVITSIDSRLQAAANHAIRDGLQAYDRRHGFRGPEANFELSEANTPEDWNALLAGFSASNGLQPALVTEVSEEFAMLYLADGQTVLLELAAMSWARPYIDVDRTGGAPRSVDDVLDPGDLVRVARDQDGGWRLAQIPDVQGALVSISPRDGRIRALTGGWDFGISKFNRVTQGKRQPGSSFKPFIYSAALERGFTASTLINDAPVVFDDPNLERAWRPQNYSQKFYGPTRLREGMVNSRNLVSIRVLRAVGVDFAVDYVSQFGFPEDLLSRDLSLALGSPALPPLTMARAYATLANGGHLIDPWFVTSIVDDRGQAVYRADPPVVCERCPDDVEMPPRNDYVDASGLTVAGQGEAIFDDNFATLPVRAAPRVADARNVYIINSFLRDVIRRGTGRKALELGRDDLFGKTGTANDQRDAWFSGFNHHLATTVWVGFDALSELGRGEVGGRAALPIWVDFMGVALRDVPERLPQMPTGLVNLLIDPDTGLAASADSPDAINEIFRSDHLPEAEVAQVNAGEEDPEAVDLSEIF